MAWYTWYEGTVKRTAPQRTESMFLGMSLGSESGCSESRRVARKVHSLLRDDKTSGMNENRPSVSVHTPAGTDRCVF